MNETLVKWAAYAALVAFVAGGSYLEGVKHEKAKHSAAIIEQQATVITTERAQQTKADHVETTVQNARVVAAVDGDRAGAAVVGLRRTIDQLRADAVSEATTRASLAAEVAASTESLSQCSQQYRSVAEIADQLSIQVTGLLALIPDIDKD